MDAPAPRAVFLSYAHEDADIVRSLAAALRDRNVEVWFDQSELRGGDAWDQKIRRQIKECALFVPVISQRTQERREGYFRREWKLAVERFNDMAEGTPFIVPLCVDDIRESGALVPEAFMSVQWTALKNGATPEGFCDRVRKLLGGHQDVQTNPRQLPQSGGTTSISKLLIPDLASAKSVAVLAFENRSSDPENEYFSDGISEELLNVLAKIPGLRVAARTSAFSFKGRNVPAPEIARQLNVAHLVEGSVRKSGNRVRISVQLVKAADGFHRWSETYDRELGDIFALQDDVARTIVQALRAALTSETDQRSADSEIAAATRGGTRNVEAYRLFLEARYSANQLTKEAMDRAVGLYRRALDLDPSFALAWAALGRTRGLQVAIGLSANIVIHQEMEMTREAARRALALDPTLPEGHATMMMVQTMYDFDWDGAESSGRRALALAPTNVVVITNMMFLAFSRGDAAGAVAFARQAAELDPISSEARVWLMFAYLWAKQYNEAEVETRRAIELCPTAIWSFAGLSLIYLVQGRFDEAIDAALREREDYSRLAAAALAYWAHGRRADCDTALGELIKVGSAVAAYQIAWVYAYRGEGDEAFAWLDRAVAQRDSGLLVLKGDPFLRTLQEDRRWRDLLARMRMEPD